MKYLLQLKIYFAYQKVVALSFDNLFLYVMSYISYSSQVLTKLFKQISKEDAKNLEKKLRAEVLESWHEAIESTKTTKIPIEKIPGYLNHLQEAYEGKLNSKFYCTKKQIY